MKNERLKIHLEEKEKAIAFIQKSMSQAEKDADVLETDTARQVC